MPVQSPVIIGKYQLDGGYETLASSIVHNFHIGLNMLFVGVNQLRQNLLTDAWGTAMNVRFSTNLADRNTFEESVLAASKIVIWSSGAN